MSTPQRAPGLLLLTRTAIVMAAILTPAAGLFVTRSAAQDEATPLAGRWVQETTRCDGPDCPPTYDFVACGDGWCGVEVRGGKDCRRIAFRLTADPQSPDRSTFIGRFQRTAETEVYVVRASVRAPSRFDPQPAVPRLVVQGNTGGELELFRRGWPLHMVLSPQGPAQCKGEAKTS